MDFINNPNKIKPIAIYLPQFHPIEENDQWWGKGFTEWTNVTKSKPKFKGHYQPHLPSDLGFYDLRVPETQIAQAELAKAYGIYGFCYYHYWFNGELLLEKPLHILLENAKIDIPFCICWANENWSRRWDGRDQDILKEQKYDLEDDYNHIHYLLRFFKDDRYIKIDGKPVFLMYRSELHPDINLATEIWRTEAKKAGFPGLYLIRVENFEKNINPHLHNFDAGMEFAPDNFNLSKTKPYKNVIVNQIMKAVHKYGISKNDYYDNNVFNYNALIEDALTKDSVEYKYFRSVCPSWDNSARRDHNATIFKDSTPDLFKYWLKQIMQKTVKDFPKSERFIFINAWNEWGEGCHLEPDQKWGKAYLEAIKSSLSDL